MTLLVASGNAPLRLFRLSCAAIVLLVAAPSLAMAQARQSVGFIDFRYASHTSLTLFGGYQIGGTTLLAGMVQNPRTEYREVVAGVARPIGSQRWSATIAVAGAYASDGWYGQLHVLPAIRLAPVGISGVLLAYEPLEREGARQFHVNPISALVPISSRVQLGAAYSLAVVRGIATRQSAGPSVQMSISRWLVSVTALAGFGRSAGEVRIGMIASW